MPLSGREAHQKEAEANAAIRAESIALRRIRAEHAGETGSFARHRFAHAIELADEAQGPGPSQKRKGKS
jgi:hypothetical protein